MSLSLAAAGGTALALYAWRRRSGGDGGLCGTEADDLHHVDRHFTTAHRAPNSFMEVRNARCRASGGRGLADGLLALTQPRVVLPFFPRPLSSSRGPAYCAPCGAGHVLLH